MSVKRHVERAAQGTVAEERAGMEPAQTQAIHLVPEAAGTERPVVELPAGVSFLRWEPGRTPVLLSGKPDQWDRVLVAEPLFNEPQPRLLLLNPGIGFLRVNDRAADRVAVLRDGDVFRFEHGMAVQVGIFNRPRLGAPTSEVVGTQCPVCMRRFEEGARCYHCACGTVYHYEGDAGGLNCVEAGEECMGCGRAVVLQGGYFSQPEFAHEG